MQTSKNLARPNTLNLSNLKQQTNNETFNPLNTTEDSGLDEGLTNFSQAFNNQLNLCMFFIDLLQLNFKKN